MFELGRVLSDGSLPAGEIVKTFGISRVTLKNAYEREAGDILRLGRGRRSRYAARRVYAGQQADEFPVFRVDEAGTIRPAGTLITLAASESVWLPEETVISGLPPEMHDAAPRGFLGRSFARRNAELGLPADLSHWSDPHILVALSRRGEDLPGNLVTGRESFARFQDLRHPHYTPEDFPALSDAATSGEFTGSSAGGERPKFTALVEGQHRIIKFATSESDNARRWQDLLALEHTALETLRDAGISSAETRLVNVGKLRCLVVTRFDRIGVSGRRAAVTLASMAIDMSVSWADAAEMLHRQGEISLEDVQRITLLDAFGALIANTDRHHFNLMLFPTGGAYSLAPAFDQLPVAYAPPASGILTNTAFAEPRPAANTLAVWDDARKLSRTFWKRAAELPLTSGMHAIVREHAKR